MQILHQYSFSTDIEFTLLKKVTNYEKRCLRAKRSRPKMAFILVFFSRFFFIHNSKGVHVYT